MKHMMKITKSTLRIKPVKYKANITEVTFDPQKITEVMVNNNNNQNFTLIEQHQKPANDDYSDNANNYDYTDDSTHKNN